MKCVGGGEKNVGGFAGRRNGVVLSVREENRESIVKNQSTLLRGSIPLDQPDADEQEQLVYDLTVVARVVDLRG